MNTKLTLTIERKVIERAQEFARSKGHSLSEIVEIYLKTITTEDPDKYSEDAPITKSLRGSFNAPSNYDYKKELSEALRKKYIDGEKNPD